MGADNLNVQFRVIDVSNLKRAITVTGVVGSNSNRRMSECMQRAVPAVSKFAETPVVLARQCRT